MLVETPKTRVLVVDDEQLITDTLALILRQHGFDVSIAYSGEEAVQKAITVRPDVLLTDIIMGEMNGLEAAILISEELPQCKILFFSGQPATADLLNQSRFLGRDFEVMAKPVPPAIILEQIRAIVARPTPKVH
ncbi:response regulator [Acidobacteria bacterium AB60]|nr:response regulator [Acidobacteria bacterium AB60]